MSSVNSVKRAPARAQIEAETALAVATQRVSELSTMRGTDDPEFSKAVLVRDCAKKLLKRK